MSSILASGFCCYVFAMWI